MEKGLAGKTVVGKSVVITPPNILRAEMIITGTSPLVINRFSHKAIMQIAQKHEEGGKSRNKRKRDPRKFDEEFEQAKHISTDGWNGIPAPAFRRAIISACRLVGFKMTLAKLSVFVDADGYDKVDGTPLVKIISGVAHKHIAPVRNETGVVDLRSRAMYDPGWKAKVSISYDADQFSVEDITNLMMRVGVQIGLCEGRYDSPNSAGMGGWGCFAIAKTSELSEKDGVKKASKKGKELD